MTAFNDIGTYTQFVKRAFTNETVKDKVVYDASMKYIRAQEDFYNMLVDNTINLSKHFIETQTTFWFPKKDTK